MKKVTLLAGMAAIVLGLSACDSGNNNGGNTNNGGTPNTSIPTAATAPQFHGMGLSGATVFVYTDVIAKCTLDLVYSDGTTKSVIMNREAKTGGSAGQNFYHSGSAAGSFKKIAFTCVNSAGSASHTIVGG